MQEIQSNLHPGSEQGWKLREQGLLIVSKARFSESERQKTEVLRIQSHTTADEITELIRTLCFFLGSLVRVPAYTHMNVM